MAIIIKDYTDNKNKISVNFATKSCYVAAYRSVCKEKPSIDVLHSLGHSDMSNISSPATKNAMTKFQSNAKKRRSSATNTEKNEYLLKTPKNVVKKKRLINCDVTNFLTKNNIRKESELMHTALQMSEN